MKNKQGKKRSRLKRGSELKKRFFGSVEYLEDDLGQVVEIKASNGIFVLKRSHFSLAPSR